MSGLAVAFGKPNKHEVDAVMRAIAHRGPYAAGTYRCDQIVMAQNYLRADGTLATEGTKIPFRSYSPELIICYDGEIGNWAELAREQNVPDGQFREERLLLSLYTKYGAEMLGFLDNAIFALVIFDGQEIFATRDLLGIKTLFYGWKNDTLFLASELKGILQVSGEVYEFPNGYYRNGSGRFIRFAALPESPPEFQEATVEKMTRDIRDIIERSFDNRIDFSVPTGGLLSGGMDSSVINYIGSQRYKEKFGHKARIKTFALGVGESNDIHAARIVAKHIDSEHHELIVDLKRMLEVLPEVIYYLESFDPSLVRSSVSNYLISQYAREYGIEILLSGEGGDEVFCGYTYLGHCPAEELFSKQMECISLLHNNASLRLDRMNQCHSIRVVAPLISGELLQYSMAIPPCYKQKPQGDSKVEKWIFRKAYEELLPSLIVWRSKQEFSQGSGSAGVLTAYFEEQISDYELTREQVKYPFIRSPEELYYFRIFKQHFGSDRAIQTVGQWLIV
jgi:asparagine synthase (glutamine-hydrolysing)